VLDEMEAESEFDLLGLFQGTALPFRRSQDVAPIPNMVWLYRRPILDYWAEHEETLGHVVRHELIHEIGHHFGLSDEDMDAIEAQDEAD
jgi:predicted Zn-dependent protease with MMP-like domain